MSSFLQRLAKNCAIPVSDNSGDAFVVKNGEVSFYCLKCDRRLPAGENLHKSFSGEDCDLDMIYTSIKRPCFTCGRDAFYNNSNAVRKRAKAAEKGESFPYVKWYSCVVHWGGENLCRDAAYTRRHYYDVVGE